MYETKDHEAVDKTMERGVVDETIENQAGLDLGAVDKTMDHKIWSSEQDNGGSAMKQWTRPWNVEQWMRLGRIRRASG